MKPLLRLRAIALALRVLRLRAIALALRVLRLRAIALALRVLRLRAIALALRGPATIPRRLFRPFRGWVQRRHKPRARARGYVLTPLRGKKPQTHISLRTD